MSNEEQSTSGSVPNAFGNALAWKWTRQMPTYVRRSGLPTLLYALRAMANAAGELRFNSDRKPIRIQDIAKAACCDEKDARRYMDAAIRAGVVTVRGQRKRGTATLYVLLPSPFPDWQAAEDYLKSTARKPGKRPAAWSPDTESSGDRDRNQFGAPRPELTDGTDSEVRGTAPRWSSGDRARNGSGDRARNNPGVTHDSSHDGAEVVSQPQVDGPTGGQFDHQDQPRADPSPEHAAFARCSLCQQPLLPDPKRPSRTAHARCEAIAAHTAS